MHALRCSVPGAAGPPPEHSQTMPGSSRRTEPIHRGHVRTGTARMAAKVPCPDRRPRHRCHAKSRSTRRHANVVGVPTRVRHSLLAAGLNWHTGPVKDAARRAAVELRSILDRSGGPAQFAAMRECLSERPCESSRLAGGESECGAAAPSTPVTHQARKALPATRAASVARIVQAAQPDTELSGLCRCKLPCTPTRFGGHDFHQRAPGSIPGRGLCAL